MVRGRFTGPAAGALLTLIALGGCASIGPQRLGIDRADYADHLRETNKEQLLLNIVALRYGDAPLFLEVSSSLVGMIESGWSPQLLFRIATRSLNGVDNGSRDPLFAQAANPEFERLLAALGRLQRNRVLTIDVTRLEGEKFSVTGRIAAEQSEADRADIAFVRSTLDIHQAGDAMRIVFAESASAPDELAIGTRSMFEIFSEMAQGVEVPPADGSRAMPTTPSEPHGEPLIRIQSGNARPADAHAAVRYRGYWFWIDGDDVASKRMFLVAQILLSLNDTSGSANAPVVTIPTG